MLWLANRTCLRVSNSEKVTLHYYPDIHVRSPFQFLFPHSFSFSVSLGGSFTSIHKILNLRKGILIYNKKQNKTIDSSDDVVIQ